MFRIIISLFIGVVTVGEFELIFVIVVGQITGIHFSGSSHSHSALSSVSLSAALNFTCDWAEARVTTNTTYKSFSNSVVRAEIGLHVGLYGINVTLKGESLLPLLCATATLQS